MGVPNSKTVNPIYIIMYKILPKTFINRLCVLTTMKKISILPSFKMWGGKGSLRDLYHHWSMVTPQNGSYDRFRYFLKESFNGDKHVSW